VPGHGEVGLVAKLWLLAEQTAAASPGVPRADDLAVPLEGDRPADVQVTKIGDHDPSRTEGGVEGPVGVVPDQREVVVGVADDDDLAVALDDQASTKIVAAELGDHLSSGSERGLQR